MKRFRFELNKEYHKAQKYAKKNYSPRVYELWQKTHGKEYIKVRFFGACEYGSRRGRPHAHCIIYGWEDEKAIPIEFNKKLNVIYHSDIIEKHGDSAEQATNHTATTKRIIYLCIVHRKKLSKKLTSFQGIS